MNIRIASALISVYYKDGLEPLARYLHQSGVILYSTGGTQQYLESLGLPVHSVESVTQYPGMLGGRVKTLHPLIFGGILARRNQAEDQEDIRKHAIPLFDLVIVDLYPFEETVASTDDEQLIIEKIDIGGPSMLRAAAKNFQYTTSVASKDDYDQLHQWLKHQHGEITQEQRRYFAARTFGIVRAYDVAIDQYFNAETRFLRYGENPHQKARFTGNPDLLFQQLQGKELSYNNLIDVDAAFQLMDDLALYQEAIFAIIKHTNVCGLALRNTLSEAWHTALSCDPESAFGGILICNQAVDMETASAIQDIFFEVLIAPGYDAEALTLLQQKKNRILLQRKGALQEVNLFRSVLDGVIQQEKDTGDTATWLEEGGRTSSEQEKKDLRLANVLAKHLKSNAIALVKNGQLLGKGCGQTSRIDALRQAIDKAAQFNASLLGAVMASDAFFPFDDCVRLAHQAGIEAFIQPGGSIRDKDSIAYCQQNNLVMIITGMRHFRH